MEKNTFRRGGIIKNLQDFNSYLNLMEKYANELRLYPTKFEMLKVIKEARLMSVYNDDQVSEFVDTIDCLNDGEIQRKLENSLSIAENFIIEAQDYRMRIEEQYGEHEAFGRLYGELLDVIKSKLNLISDTDEAKAKLIGELRRAERLKCKNDLETAWGSLYRVRLWLDLSRDYFYAINLEEQRKINSGKGGKQKGASTQERNNYFYELLLEEVNKNGLSILEVPPSYFRSKASQVFPVAERSINNSIQHARDKIKSEHSK
ncbi:hypothetical protein [Pseudoalteromonas sp.]|uniref:hypothetical protein n=1 Tax=unclassified Pseudoalteromonas TaxID=194690 RepID=UPI003F977302